MTKLKKILSDVYVELYFSIAIASLPFMMFGTGVWEYASCAVGAFGVLAAIVRMCSGKCATKGNKFHGMCKELYYPYILLVVAFIDEQRGGEGYGDWLWLALGVAAFVIVSCLVPNKEEE